MAGVSISTNSAMVMATALARTGTGTGTCISPVLKSSFSSSPSSSSSCCCCCAASWIKHGIYVPSILHCSRSSRNKKRHVLISMNNSPSTTTSNVVVMAASSVLGDIDMEKAVNLTAELLDKYPVIPYAVAVVIFLIIPLTQHLLERSKLGITVDAAYKALQNDPSAFLIDIRKKNEIRYGGSIDAPLIQDKVIQVPYNGDDTAFLNEVKQKCKEPGKANLYILDMYDLKAVDVAQLLLENGYKVYSIKGGFEGKEGWQAMEEKMLLKDIGVRTSSGDAVPVREAETASSTAVLDTKTQEPKGSLDYGKEDMDSTTSQQSRPQSPFAAYPDLKPPTSPTPSKPTSKLSDAFHLGERADFEMLSKDGSISYGQRSPYTMYPNMKPPTSPTPSKPTIESSYTFSTDVVSDKSYDEVTVSFNSRSLYPKYPDLKPPTSPTPLRP